MGPKEISGSGEAVADKICQMIDRSFRSSLFRDEKRKSASDSVAILLCTFNGQDFLAEQLRSIEGQDFENWQLWVSDDGSSDGTQCILTEFKEKWAQNNLDLMMVDGPRRGVVANFLSLACRSDIQSPYYAFSDQDDVWEHWKLKKAVKALAAVPATTPAVYCSRTCVVNAQGGVVGYSPLFSKPPSFANALLQNVAGGNTMVFNHSAMHLLRVGGSISVPMHDWWLYLLVSGCGGAIFYDATPSVKYRQHGNNIVGANAGWKFRLKRLRRHWAGQFHAWNSMNIEALGRVRNLLTPQSKKILWNFSVARDRGLVGRFIGIWRSGVYAQTRFGGVSLLLLVLFNKL